ncbi:MAG: hypothetical protein QW828_06685 [Candidatus Bathyarchaeia archaeon]
MYSEEVKAVAREFLVLVIEYASQSHFPWKQKEAALAREALEIIESSKTTEHQIHFFYSVTTDESSPGEEWWERSRCYEFTLDHQGIKFMSYDNLATMIGASQSNYSIYRSWEADADVKLHKWIEGVRSLPEFSKK